MSSPDSTKRIDLGFRPRAWQKQCHAQRRRFTVLALHRRAGKTELAIIELLHNALQFREPLGMFAYIAPLLTQARAIAWARLKSKVREMIVAGFVEVHEQQMSVTFKHNGATIRLFGGDNPDALRGLRLDGVVVDEVAQAKPELWEDVLLPCLADRKGWAMFIGTPSGINLFSQLFYKGLSGDPDWWAAKYTVFDTGALDPEEVERQRANQSETTFAREYMCDFSAAGSDQLISMADVEAAASRAYRPGEMDHAPIILGCDPARFGDDRTVIIRRQGLVAFDPVIMQGANNMEVATRLASDITMYDPDATFVDSGQGAGVIDRVRQLGHDCIEVPFGGKATKLLKYVNRRTEMWCEMADWIRAGGCIPNVLSLKIELSTPTYSFDAQGRMVLESKDDIKKRLHGGASPDIADALALTFASPVGKRQMLRKQASSPREYDPFAQF